MPYTPTQFNIDEQSVDAVMREAPSVISRVGDRMKFDIPRLTDDRDYQKMHLYFVNGPADSDLHKAQKCIDDEDYNHFDSLSYGGVSYQCNKLFRQIRAEFGDDGITMDNGDFREYAEKNINNPFFRLAMEMAGNTADLAPASLRDACRDVGVRLNQMTMHRTVDPPTDEQKARLAGTLGESGAREALEKNRLEQLAVAKTMFMAHLGDFHTVSENGTNKPYTGTVTEAFAHGARTFFCFGSGEPGDNTIENNVFHDIRTGEDGRRVDHGTPLVSRLVGTHGVQTLDGEEGADAFRETKSKGSSKGVHAMNPAIGGIGNRYGNMVMQNDGKSGHVFVKIQEGTREKGGYMMIGFEGERSLSTGKSGHVHNLAAKKAKVSAFSSGKGAPGAETGGRVVDLSLWGPEATGAIMGKFNEAYASLQDECARNVPGSRERMAQINEKLSGKLMDRERFIDFMRSDLGVESVKIKGANNTAKEYSLDELMDYREAVGKKHFDNLNRQAEERRIARDPDAPARGNANGYSLGDGLGDLSERLAQTRYVRFGKDQGDSKLMKNVKESLRGVLDLKSRDDATPEQMKMALAKLKADSAKYLKERSAKNDRREIVGEINKFVRGEMEAIDEYLDMHPERGHDEIQPDNAPEANRPAEGPRPDVL